MKVESTVSLVHRLVRTAHKRAEVLTAIAEKECLGYDFARAGASLHLLIERLHNGKKLPFAVASYHVSMRGSMEREAETNHICEASVKVRVKGAEYFEVAEGNGPVRALDGAIRLALGKSSLPDLSLVRLLDYSVELVSRAPAGTDATTRVRVVTGVETAAWSTMGVSENVVEASLFALVDSLEYALMRVARR